MVARSLLLVAILAARNRATDGSVSSGAESGGHRDLLVKPEANRPAVARFCCMFADDKSDVCGNCGAPENDSWCGQSSDNCLSCGKVWCDGSSDQMEEAVLEHAGANASDNVTGTTPRSTRADRDGRGVTSTIAPASARQVGKRANSTATHSTTKHGNQHAHTSAADIPTARHKHTRASERGSTAASATATHASGGASTTTEATHMVHSSKHAGRRDSGSTTSVIHAKHKHGSSTKAAHADHAHEHDAHAGSQANGSTTTVGTKSRSTSISAASTTPHADHGHEHDRHAGSQADGSTTTASTKSRSTSTSASSTTPHRRSAAKRAARKPPPVSGYGTPSAATSTSREQDRGVSKSEEAEGNQQGRAAGTSVPARSLLDRTEKARPAAPTGETPSPTSSKSRSTEKTTSTTSAKSRTSTTSTVVTTTTTTRTKRRFPNPSMMCWMVIMTSGYELDLVKPQCENYVSIWRCDEHIAFSDYATELCNGEQTVPVGDMTSKISSWGSWSNTANFLRVWGILIRDGRFRDHEWTVKVDADSVFYPERLRRKLTAFPADKALFLHNWNDNFGFLGPVEVLSTQAVIELGKGNDTCADTIGVDDTGEDGYLDSCLKLLNVDFEDAFDILDFSGSVDSCGNPDVATFHPYKSWDKFSDCMSRGPPMEDPPPVEDSDDDAQSDEAPSEEGAGEHEASAKEKDAKQDTEEEGFCCSAAQNPEDPCNTCWENARVGRDSWCGGSKDRCESCAQTWCGGSDDSAVWVLEAFDDVDEDRAPRAVQQDERLPTFGTLAAAGLLLSFVGFALRSRGPAAGVPERLALVPQEDPAAEA